MKAECVPLIFSTLVTLVCIESAVVLSTNDSYGYNSESAAGFNQKEMPSPFTSLSPPKQKESSEECPLARIEIILPKIGRNCKNDTRSSSCMRKIWDTDCQKNCDASLILIIVTLALSLKYLLSIVVQVAARINIQLAVLLYILILLDLTGLLQTVFNLTENLTLEAVAKIIGLLDTELKVNVNANILADIGGLLGVE